MKAIEFYTKLTETLKEKLGNEWIAELHTDVILNNGTNHIALILYKNGEKLHPQIYLERFFEDYKKGIRLQVGKGKVLEAAVETPDSSFDLSFLFDYGNMNSINYVVEDLGEYKVIIVYLNLP